MRGKVIKVENYTTKTGKYMAYITTIDDEGTPKRIKIWKPISDELINKTIEYEAEVDKMGEMKFRGNTFKTLVMNSEGELPPQLNHSPQPEPPKPPINIINKDEQINRSVALKAAVDLYVGTYTGPHDASIENATDAILKYAQLFENYLNGNLKALQKEKEE